MPKIQTTRVFSEIQKAYEQGYTTVSEQGSSRSSKTFNTIIWLIAFCARVPGTTVSVVRATLPSLKGSVLRDFKENMIKMQQWDSKRFNKSELFYQFPNGSWVEFFSCDDEQKLRGRKRKILYVNEGNELKFIEWQQLQMRTTMFSIIDYNPSFTDDHWLCQLNREPKTHHFITTYKDNPFLEQKVIDEIESLKEKNPSLWRIYGLGLQAIIEGLVFENVETIPEIPWIEKQKAYLSVDYGYSHDLTAIVEVAIWKDTIYIDEVCYRTKMLSSDIIDVFKEKNRAERRNYQVISESADPRLIDEIYNAGIDIHPVHKFGGSVMAGITKMLEYKIRVTEHSTNVMKEFKNYTYRQDKEGHWLNEPIDAFNHCFVGSTLVATARGGVRIDQLTLADRVHTSRGLRAVHKLFSNGKQIVHDYIIKGDTFVLNVSCTPTHLVKTKKRGWVAMGQLREGMEVYLIGGEAQMVKEVSCSNERTEEVYDIEVAGTHEYYAQGLLVHNCIDAVRYVILEKVLGDNGDGLDVNEIADII